MNDKSQMLQLLQDAKRKLEIDALKQSHEEELNEVHRQRTQEVKTALLEGENRALRRPVETTSAAGGARAARPAVQAALSPVAPASIPFEKVVAGFLASPAEQKSPAMLKKHQTVLPLLLDVVGRDRAIDTIRQADINKFFDMVAGLPPRWNDTCRRRKISAAKLATEDHPITLGKKTLEDTYVACVRAFLKAAKRNWQDEGFPTGLTTEGVKYAGSRKDGEAKQRAFKRPELERLFFGAELIAFRASPDLEHQFWLPALGLVTGARVNEIAQINPMTDVCQDAETGIWYLNITEDTATHELVTKSTKNDLSERKVPIHDWLIKLGFLDYVARMREARSSLLFPLWKPSRGKASSTAEKWFRMFLVKVGLQDKTPGAQLVGMHAFRHTLLTAASNTVPPVDATSITGHAGAKDAVVRGYSGELSLVNKRQLLHQIRFDIDLTAAPQL